MNINLYDLLKCLSSAQDLVNKELTNHHHQVAYLSYRIAEHINLSYEEKRNIILAGLLHDIGALAMNESLAEIEDSSATAYNHAYVGSMLLSEFEPLKQAAELIKYHHHPWNAGTPAHNIPIGSHILHIADRICVLMRPEENILLQVPQLVEHIKEKRGTQFSPELVDCVEELQHLEYIWLDLMYNYPMNQLDYPWISSLAALNIDEIIDFSMIFSRIIDFRSSFTANHSAGVAKTAERLAQLFGYSEHECKMMLIAGYLHDLGKLAIDNSILEKPSGLTVKEYHIVKSHPFYTYRILNVIEGFDIISKWAAYHHEKPDGSGYPFHLDDSNLPLGSKIVAVADVFTAITENRPYRKGMSDEACISILRNLAAENALCSNVVFVLLDHFSEIRKICADAQIKAGIEYARFKDSLKHK
ncbi:MAG: phosphohydrolase [Oscillospiraceae bacterium]|nr:phosphohydrolase [Oscillospiraceae bacterium]